MLCRSTADAKNPHMDLCISVSDNGSGIPLESQEHIFDPFYTTKPVGVGTGIGLGIVQRIVDQYNGVIRFTSEPGSTEFVVRLPSDS
jgi:signal transduction histidine kinase